MNSNATVKIVLNPKDRGEKKLLRLRVTFNRISRYYSLNSDRRLSEDEFANDKLKIHKDALAEVKAAYDIATAIVERLGKDFTFDGFRKQYKDGVYGEKKDVARFSVLAKEYIEGLTEVSTRKLYQSSANWVEKVRAGIKIESIDEEFVDSMVMKMKEESVSENTIRLHSRQLKAIYQRAIETGLVKGDNPFRKYAKASTGRVLSGLSNEEFALLKSYKPKTADTAFGKDFSILSFACSGANIGDILRLKNGNIQETTIQFIRHKTKNTNPVPIVIPLIPEATRILQKYGRIDRLHPDYYVLPYLSKCQSEEAIKNKIHDVVKKINGGLKDICDEIGLRKITTYDARHSYATLARDTGLGESQLQKMLGHKNLKTTTTYLGKLSTSVLDKNSKVINKMLDNEEEAKHVLEQKQLEALYEKFGKDEVMKILEAKTND